MRVTIRHTTSFGYPEPAARTTQFRDHWGTLVQAFNINAPHDHLTIVGESRVVTYPRPALPDSQSPAGGAFDDLDDPALRDPLSALEVESHAWVEAYVPGHGWVAYDPTNDCPADERHVTVAVGRDYSDVPPVRGTLLGGRGQQLDVAVTMVAPSSPFPDTPSPSASGWRSASHQTPRRDRLATLQSEQQQQ